MKKVMFFLIACLQVHLITSCSTPKVTMQSVPIASIPLDADVYANGILIGKTPVAVNLERNRTHQVVIKKEGYVPQCITITRNIDQRKLYTKAGLEALDDMCFFKSPEFGLGSVQSVLEEEEITGKFSSLEPNSIVAELKADAVAGLKIEK